MSDHGLAPRALRDIESANRIGRFQIRDLELAVTLAVEALFGLMHLLRERPQRDQAQAVDRLAQGLLIVYGLSTEEAQEVCMRALPGLDDIAVGDAPARRDATVVAMLAHNGQVTIG